MDTITASFKRNNDAVTAAKALRSAGDPAEEGGASLRVTVADPVGKARVVEILRQHGAAQVIEE